MRSKAQYPLCAIAILIATVSATRTSRANTSSWSDKVGFVLGDDSTTWCETALTSSGATSSFRRVPSDSSQPPTSPFVNNVAAQMVRVQCSFFGSTQVVTAAAWSTDAGGDQSSVSCPAFWTPTLAECRVDGHIDNGPVTTLPYVYQGSACGNGIASINKSTLVSELLNSPSAGFTPYQPWPTMNAVNPLGMPNNTASVSVGGADLGSIFLQGGVLNIAFGDTLSGCGSGCSPAVGRGFRPGTLARTTNLDPSAGIVLQQWETTNGAARAIFTAGGGEASVVAGGGFAMSPASGPETRFLWYFSVKQWGPPFLANYSGLAKSESGGAWGRGQGPVWPANSNFGPGAVWQDRYNQWIYFFGVRPQLGTPNDPGTLPYSGVRVARVRSNANAILDPKQYQYWSGSAWIADTQGNYAPAIPRDQGGLFGAEADIVWSQALPRSEISVAYDSYANVWIMMILDMNDAGIRLLASSAITGPWVEVPFDTFALPNPALLPAPPPPHPPGVYAPFTSDHLMLGAGTDVYYLLSEWYPVYNVGEWHFTVNRNTSCSLTP
jgi:hypothetical protein